MLENARVENEVLAGALKERLFGKESENCIFPFLKKGLIN